MDAILVRCKQCKHAMKFSAEKAGKKAKCPKCETIVVVEAEEPAAEEPAPPAPNPAPAAAPDDEYDPTGGYGVALDPELEKLRVQRAAEEEARTNKKKKDKQDLPKVTRKKKAIPDAEAWKKVRLALLFTFIGTCIWGFTHIAQGSYVVLGKAEFPEYAQLIAINLEQRGGEEDFPARREFWNVDELQIYLGMIAGRDLQGFAKTMLTLGTLFYFIQALCWGAGNLIALPVPRRFGMLGQLIAANILSVVNFILMFIFKLLPVLGIMSYVMIPYVTPEIVLTEYNMERQIPINLMWSGAPFWENFLNLFFKLALYLQPTFGCIFLWSIGLAIKEDILAEGGKGLTQSSLGTFFILFSFHMLSMCGSSVVLVWLLRVLYTLWFFFLFLFILQYASMIMRARALLYEKIYPKNVLE